MKRTDLRLSLILLSGIISLSATGAEAIRYQQNSATGAISRLSIAADPDRMNWLVMTDGSQYPWIRESYGWGLGYFTQKTGGGADRFTAEAKTERHQWTKPFATQDNTVTYQEGNVLIRVERALREGKLTERYTLTNQSKGWLYLEDIGIYTPFNDNYPDSKTCITSRCNAHIWAGGSAAYVCAERMGGKGPHIGLVVTDGQIAGYNIWGRSRTQGGSHMRGIMALALPDLRLRAGQSYSVAWEILSFGDLTEFRRELIKTNGLASSDRYVYQKGETARVVLQNERISHCEAFANGVMIPVTVEGSQAVAEVPLNCAGEVRIDFRYNAQRQTHVSLWVIDNVRQLISDRASFILNHQQMNNRNDARDGAFMVYDCEADSIYQNDRPNCNPVDRDEGAERVGMGVFLARHFLAGNKSPELLNALTRYAVFLRNKLQTPDYKTFSSVDQTNRNRAYNYPWIAEFYFCMYSITGDRHYAYDGYMTLRSMFSQFGHNFYAIGFPVRQSLKCLKEADMKSEYRKLMRDFTEEGASLIRNGLNYPKSEVNYEQSIVAPAIQFLAQMYLVTGDRKYLDEVKRQMPVVEAFNGFQPDYHLNDIAIRHWDGHWFGKYELFGDTFPHYWSTITASVFHLYSLCTGDTAYQQRAENIVNNNLCLFFEGGKASCAYLYPDHVNGVKARFFDPYANDQDWALAYYYQVKADGK